MHFSYSFFFLQQLRLAHLNFIIFQTLTPENLLCCGLQQTACLQRCGGHWVIDQRCGFPRSIQLMHWHVRPGRWFSSKQSVFWHLILFGSGHGKKKQWSPSFIWCKASLQSWLVRKIVFSCDHAQRWFNV